MKMLKTVAVALFVLAMGYQVVKAEGEMPVCPACGKADAVVAVDKAGEPVKAKCAGCSQEMTVNEQKQESVHVCKTCNTMIEKCDACVAAAAAPAAEAK